MKNEIDDKSVEIKSIMDGIVEEINQIETEKTELSKILELRMQQIKQTFQFKSDKLDKRKEQLMGELRVLFEQVESKETKTQRKVSLLSGDVVIKNSIKKIDYDKNVLLENADNYGLSEYVKTKEINEFDWASLKSNLKIDGESIINTDTGEILDIEGITIVEVPEQLIIK